MTYTSKTKYVDIDTGQQLTAKHANKHYLIIKTRKNVTTKWTEGKCYIEYTKLCRRNPQTNLFN